MAFTDGTEEHRFGLSVVQLHGAADEVEGEARWNQSARPSTRWPGVTEPPSRALVCNRRRRMASKLISSSSSSSRHSKSRSSMVSRGNEEVVHWVPSWPMLGTRLGTVLGRSSSP
jgi:hypothetical protein